MTYDFLESVTAIRIRQILFFPNRQRRLLYEKTRIAFKRDYYNEMHNHIKYAIYW
jgi:hypothetical protein